MQPGIAIVCLLLLGITTVNAAVVCPDPSWTCPKKHHCCKTTTNVWTCCHISLDCCYFGYQCCVKNNEMFLESLKEDAIPSEQIS